MKSKKVLILKLGALGDVVHTTIIADAIKAKHPDWTVDFLTGNLFVSLLNNHPSIDNIMIWQDEYKTLKGFFKIVKILFDKHYDYFFTPALSLRTFLFSLLIFAKKVRFKKKTGDLWVKDYFQMAKSVIKDLEMPEKLSLGISNEILVRIDNEISKYPKPYFAIAPGRVIDNSRQGRLWNIEKWKELTQLLTNKYGGTIFVLGSADEFETHKLLIGDNVIIKTGKYSIEDTKALLSKADLVISGDTGPIHIASAFDVRTLALLGSTNPKHIKPYGENGHYVSADYDCLYCWKKKCPYLKESERYTPCMESLNPEKVFDKIQSIMNN